MGRTLGSLILVALLTGCSGEVVAIADASMPSDASSSDSHHFDDAWRDYDAWPYWDAAATDGRQRPLPGETPSTNGDLCVCAGVQTCQDGYCCAGKLTNGRCMCGSEPGCNLTHQCCDLDSICIPIHFACHTIRECQPFQACPPN